MIDQYFYSWGYSNRRCPKVEMKPAADPQSYNASYLKAKKKVKTPFPDGKKPTLMNKGSDQNGHLVAKVVSITKDEAFNQSYLQPNPSNSIKIPPPKPYSISGVFEELKESGENAESSTSEDMSPIEKATKIRDTQEEDSDL